MSEFDGCWFAGEHRRGRTEEPVAERTGSSQVFGRERLNVLMEDGSDAIRGGDGGSVLIVEEEKIIQGTLCLKFSARRLLIH